MAHKHTWKWLAFLTSLSLKHKMIIAVLSVSLIPMASIAWYGYSQSTQAYISSALSKDRLQLASVENSISSILEKIPHDLSFLSEFHDMHKYMLWHDIGEEQEATRWFKSTNHAFLSFMASNSNYMQLRVIDQEGQEVIRIERKNQGAKAKLSTVADLQNKKNRSYFSETMNKPVGEFYVSPLNLNREHGRVQSPHIPVIRYALPIIDKNEVRRGIIILNVFADSFLSNVTGLASHANPQEEFFLSNSDGFYLAHGNPDATFGFDLGHAHNLIHEYPAVWDMIQADQAHLMEANDATFSYQSISPMLGVQWHLVHSIPNDVLFAALNRFQEVFLSILLLFFAAIFFFVLPMIIQFISPISHATRELKKLAQGQTGISTVQYRGHDELSEMIEALATLDQNMNNTVQQANAIAEGDFRSDVNLLSDKDKLGKALQNMTTTLRSIGESSVAIAAGDYSKDVLIKGDFDVLGASVSAMIKSLRTVVHQANAISQGDFRADITPLSDQDALGKALKQMTENLRLVAKNTAALATGDYTQTIEVKGEYDQLGRSVAELNRVLQENDLENSSQNWLKSNLTELGRSMQKQNSLQALCKKIMLELPRIVGAKHATLFVYQASQELLTLEASYAYTQRKSISNRYKLGEGLIGQCALENQPIVLTQAPDDYIQVSSALGECSPKEIIVLPLSDDRGLVGVVELASLTPFTPIQHDFLTQIATSIGIALRFVMNSSETTELLVESERMTSELQEQQNELHEANSMLEERAKALEKSELLLHAQQDALQKNNNELVTKNELVEEQKATLQQASAELEQKAEQLSDASKYKSEFLANMSHELRTPMNSIIGFTGRVIKKSADDLPERQLRNLKTVERNANHLLALINSLLDISKIEAGKMEIFPESFPLYTLAQEVIELTQALVEAKHLTIDMDIDASLTLFNDKTKLKQVFINLISNAVKFTNEGGISLHAKVLSQSDNTEIGLDEGITFVEIKVSDTGIGMDQQALEYIFEAFRQVDGSNTRSYGGTGLGLNISSRFCYMMAGSISVESDVGEGSNFIVRIPQTFEITAEALSLNESHMQNPSPNPSPNLPPQQLANIVETIQSIQPAPKGDEKDDSCILCIDDNPEILELFQGYLSDAGYRCLVASNGQDGLELARKHLPLAIVLDVQMPYMDGWAVLRSLKDDAHTEKIPVLMATMMDNKALAYQLGAFAYLEKPVNPNSLINSIGNVPHRIRNVLVVDDEESVCDLMEQMLTDHGMNVSIARNGLLAIQALESMDTLPDMIILDLMMPKMNGFEVLEKMSHVQAWATIPVIISTAKILSREEEELLALRSQSVLQKGGSHLDQLLHSIQGKQETAHQVQS
ncbi:MAG: response regulator [Ghiorsea sp.]